MLDNQKIPCFIGSFKNIFSLRGKTKDLLWKWKYIFVYPPSDSFDSVFFLSPGSLLQIKRFFKNGNRFMTIYFYFVNYTLALKQQTLNFLSHSPLLRHKVSSNQIQLVFVYPSDWVWSFSCWFSSDYFLHSSSEVLREWQKVWQKWRELRLTLDTHWWKRS